MKYQKENQGWIIKRPDGYMMRGSYTYYRSNAQWYLISNIFGNEYTWKQLYTEGYRAVKVEVKEIEGWG